MPLMPAQFGVGLADGALPLDTARRQAVAIGLLAPHILARNPPRRRTSVEFARRRPINVFLGANVAFGFAHCGVTQRPGRGRGSRGRTLGRLGNIRARRLVERVLAGAAVAVGDGPANDGPVGRANADVLRGGRANRTTQENQRQENRADVTHMTRPLAQGAPKASRARRSR
jgi:hypothetical protein